MHACEQEKRMQKGETCLVINCCQLSKVLCVWFFFYPKGMKERQRNKRTIVDNTIFVP